MDVFIFSQTRQDYPQSWQSIQGFFSNRPNWDSLTRRRVCPLPLWFWRGPLASGRGGGVSQFRRETDTGTLYMYFVGISLWPLNFSPVCLSVSLSTAPIFSSFPVLSACPFSKCCLLILSIYRGPPIYIFCMLYWLELSWFWWHPLGLAGADYSLWVQYSSPGLQWGLQVCILTPSLRKYSDQRCQVLDMCGIILFSIYGWERKERVPEL